MIWVRLNSEKQKRKVMKKKGALRGRTEWIEEDLNRGSGKYNGS